MIITVFVSGDNEQEHWRAQLLEHSWQQCGQAGELVRLVACPPGNPLPAHGLARVVGTMPWKKHPYLDDEFAAYNKPAALLEWLLREPVDATILLLDSDSILLEPFEQEVMPGEAVANRWQDCSTGEAPFGLGSEYINLQAFCVNRELNIPRVQLPVLIHSSDLIQMAARWLELTGIIRCEVTSSAGKCLDADKTAYAIAAAEYRIPHKARKLAVTTGERKANRPVLDYREPIESPKGKIVWDIEAYRPWDLCSPEQAGPGAGREFLAYLLEYATLRESGGHLRFGRPRRCPGVREAQVLDSMLLEIPGKKEPLTLNSSASTIWKLCDGNRTMADIADVIANRFEVPRQLLCSDIEMAINQLHSDAALELESVS